MPPVACSIRPARGAAAPVNAPRAWPNSSFSSSDSVSAAQLSATNGFAARGLPAWIARAASSLPVPGLAGDQHRARRRRRARDQFLHLLHGGLAADERSQRARRLDLPLQQIDLPRELPPLGRRPDAHQQLVAEERLLHEVDGAELHRFDRGVDGAEAGHDDEGGIDADVAQLAQDVEAGDAGHPHVGEDDVEGAAARQLEAFFAARRRLHGVAGGAQHPLHAVAHARVVVDDEDARHRVLT